MAEFDLSTLTTGILKHTVAGGESTPATAAAGVDYVSPIRLAGVFADPATDLTFSGITYTTTARASITAGDWVYMGTDGVYKAEGDAATHCPAVGIATQTKGVGESIIVGRLGKWRNDALTLTVGSVGAGILWLSPTTAGADVQAADPNTIYDTVGQIAQQLGWAHSATIKFVAPDNTTVTKGDTPLVSGGALGTPASGNLANCTFPTLNQDTTGSAVYWKTSGTGKAALAGPGTGQTRTYTGPDADTTLVGTTTTQTLTNKRVTPRIVSPSSGATMTPSFDTMDIADLVCTEGAGTLTIANPSGTPTDGQHVVIRVECTNAQTGAWGDKYRAATVPGALPTTGAHGAGKINYFNFYYHAGDDKYDYVGVAGPFTAA